MTEEKETKKEQASSEETLTDDLKKMKNELNALFDIYGVSKPDRLKIVSLVLEAYMESLLSRTKGMMNEYLPIKEK